MVATKKKNYESATPIGRITKETATPIGKVNSGATSLAKAKQASALGAKRKSSSILSKGTNLNNVSAMQASMNKLKKEYGGATTSLGGEVGKKQNLAKSYAEHRNTKKKVGKSY